MPYQIIYLPDFTGRAEPAILLLEDAGIGYEIVTNSHERIAALANEHPVFAPPVLLDGNVVISQTSAIVEYLGAKHGYDVAPEHRIAASMLGHNAADIWREIYVGRKNDDEAFFADRYPRWIQLLDNSFSAAGEGQYLFSATGPTYPDFLVLNLTTLATYCWGEPARTLIDAQPRLGPWVRRMCARPAMAAYFANPASLPVGREAVRVKG